MKYSRFTFLVIVMFLCVTQGRAQDWPQYLGPHRNSTSDQKGILREWPEKGPEILWTADLGVGYGGAVVRNGKVYILDRDDNTGDKMRSFDLSSGKELWSFAYDAPGSVRFPGSRSVPVTDGKYVWSCGPYGDLYCFDITAKKPVWNKNVWKDFGGHEIPDWAISQCPLIYGDLVILASQAPQAGVVAYEKLSGKLKWATPALGPVGYVSPSIVKISGEDHVVMITASGSRTNGTGKVAGIDPISGKILWEYTNWQCVIPVPGAVDAGESKVLITGGYHAGTALLKVVKRADGGFEVTELFKTIDFGEHTKTPLLYNGYFYGQYSTNERRDGLVCMSMDGRVLWKTARSPGFDKGSMILADGLILATNGGKFLYLIEPDTTAFKPLAAAEVLREEPAQDERAARYGIQNWAPTALADGKLLIRDQRRLVCLKVAQ